MSSILKKGDCVWVRPTLVRSPWDFYVRRIEDETWLCEFKKKVAEASDNLPRFPAVAPPRMRSAALLYHDTLGWTRGSITYLRRGWATVYLMDYGETVYDVNTAELRLLKLASTRAPLAIHCCLNFCKPYKGRHWSRDSIAAFQEFLSNGPMLMTVINKSSCTPVKFVVELKNRLPETISVTMVVEKRARFISDSNKLQRFQSQLHRRNHYTCDSFVVGRQSIVRIIASNYNDFYVVRDEQYANYLSMGQLIEAEFDTCNSLVQEHTSTGTPVVCKLASLTSPAQYCRGEIVSVDYSDVGDYLVHVYFVDQGRYEWLPISKHIMRETKPSLLAKPTCAISCVLTYRQQQSEALCALVYPGVRLMVKAVKTKAGITNPQIIDILQHI